MAAPTPQIDLKAQAWEGARLILQESLSLNAGDRLVLFHDEQGVAVANLVGEVARSLRLRYTPRFVPRERQGQGVAEGDSGELESADGILIALTEDLRTTGYRRMLVEKAAVDQRVVGVLTPTLAALAQKHRHRQGAPQEQWGELAQILLAGRDAEITTAVLDARGDVIEEHCLSVELVRYERCPATAGEAIAAGTWAPLPLPETVVAPREESASGVFVLNGAFAGGAMTGQEHLLLVFAGGRLEMVGGNSPRVGEFWNVVESGKAPGGQALSLGFVGVRHAGDATGQNLVQLGLGDNTALGGKLRSAVQETLLSRGASLTVDGRPVLRQGRLVHDRTVWQETRATAHQLAARVGSDLRIGRTANTAHVDVLGRLWVMRRVGPQRTGGYRIGDNELSVRLGDLYQHLADLREPMPFPELLRLCMPGTIAASLQELRGLLGVLERHQLIQTWPA